jgi:hypothetical protein
MAHHLHLADPQMGMNKAESRRQIRVVRRLDEGNLKAVPMNDDALAQGKPAPWQGVDAF